MSVSFSLTVNDRVIKRKERTKSRSRRVNQEESKVTGLGEEGRTKLTLTEYSERKEGGEMEREEKKRKETLMEEEDK